MKARIISLTLVSIVIIAGSNAVEAQDFSRPIVINPSIGDTLDRFESKRYGMFGSVSGFQSATYAMGDDSSLYAKVITKNGNKVDSFVEDCGPAQKYIDKNFPSGPHVRPYWANSVFIGLGNGNPLGQRYELGVNIAGHVALALIARAHDKWSGTSNGQGALGLRIIGPFIIYRFAPYFSLETGSSLALFGGSNTYKSYSIGLAVTATRWLQVRSEFGSVHTSRYISGGPGLFGDMGPIVRENMDQTSFNLGIEIDLNGIF